MIIALLFPMILIAATALWLINVCRTGSLGWLENCSPDINEEWHKRMKKMFKEMAQEREARNKREKP